VEFSKTRTHKCRIVYLDIVFGFAHTARMKTKGTKQTSERPRLIKNGKADSDSKNGNAASQLPLSDNPTGDDDSKPVNVHVLSALTPRQNCAQLVRTALGKSVAGIVEAGEILNRYRRGPDRLAHGEFEDMARRDLGFKGDSGPQVARMLMAIARHPVISNPKNFSVLPASYTTLYALAKAFPGSQLQDFIDQNLVHGGLKGDEVDELQDRLIETGRDANLYYLFARVSPLLYYAQNWPDLQEVVDRLWVLFQSYATKRKNEDRLIKNPPRIVRCTPTGLVPYRPGEGDDDFGLQPRSGQPDEQEFDGGHFHGGAFAEHSQLKRAARWLDEFADCWQQKLVDSGHKPIGAREPSPLPDSPAAADERQRLQRDREQRRQEDELAKDDDEALDDEVSGSQTPGDEFAPAPDDDDDEPQPQEVAATLEEE